MMQLIKKVTVLLLICTVMLNGDITETYAGIGDYYLEDDESCYPNGGGYLYSHCERQMYGTLSSSGVVRKVKFYVYAKYIGDKNVSRIKCAWKTGAKMRSSATMTLSTSAGKQYSFSASSSSTFQNVESSEKYWVSTNGCRVEYEQSNFTISPDCDLKGKLFWIKTTATVRVKGSAKPSSISCGC